MYNMQKESRMSEIRLPKVTKHIDGIYRRYKPNYKTTTKMVSIRWNPYYEVYREND